MADTLPSRRVVVTGIGVCSSLGLDRETFWTAALAGRRAIAPIPEAWHRFARYRSRWWSPLPPLDPGADGITAAEAMRLDPAQLLALRAARAAVAHAGFRTVASQRKDAETIVGVESGRAGVFIGTGTGGIASMLTGHLSHLLEHRKEAMRATVAGTKAFASAEAERALGDLVDEIRSVPRFNPFIVSMQMANGAAAYLAIRLSLTGACETVSLACASGTGAIGRAWRAIRRGDIDLALAGGTECLRDPHGAIFRSFDVARTLTACADADAPGGGPFDAARSGFLFSEGGSSILLLEERSAAIARGARPLAEVIGYAETNDGYHLMAPEPDGRSIDELMRRALAVGGIAPNEVEYVNTHGTGTVSNDAIEAAAISRILPHRPAVNATKSLIGHAIGASGAIEAAVACLSLRDQRLHPCAQLRDPIADLDFVRETRDVRIRHALSLSFAFGGHNSALLLRTPE